MEISSFNYNAIESRGQVFNLDVYEISKGITTFLMTITDTYTPSDFVVPVVGLDKDNGCGPFLGTGVFVDPAGVLVTCDHVIDPWHGNYGVIVERTNRLFRVQLMLREPGSDLALLKTSEYQPPHTVPLEQDSEITLNNLIVCFEYGTTMTAGQKIHLAPANRLGNVTRFRNLQDLYGEAGDYMLELSFPALKGASGSPVMNWTPPFRLWGIVKANISNELMPAQVEKVVDEKGKLSEETKFYLPQALAIHVKHVRKLLQQVFPQPVKK